MSDDQTIRIALIIAALLTFPILLYHRIKAHTGEKLDRMQEGLFIMVALRLGGVACMGALLAYLINPPWMSWSSVALPIWLRWLGILLGLITALLLLWTLRHLGRNLTDTVVTRQKATFITTGPYRFVRHPFYSCVALVILANSLAAANYFLFLTGSLLFVTMLLRTKTEEQNLIARFGDNYRTYIRTTPRFLPQIPRRSGPARTH